MELLVPIQESGPHAHPANGQATARPGSVGSFGIGTVCTLCLIDAVPIAVSPLLLFLCDWETPIGRMTLKYNREWASSRWNLSIVM